MPTARFICCRPDRRPSGITDRPSPKDGASRMSCTTTPVSARRGRRPTRPRRFLASRHRSGCRWWTMRVSHAFRVAFRAIGVLSRAEPRRHENPRSASRAASSVELGSTSTSCARGSTGFPVQACVGWRSRYLRMFPRTTRDAPATPTIRVSPRRWPRHSVRYPRLVREDRRKGDAFWRHAQSPSTQPRPLRRSTLWRSRRNSGLSFAAHVAALHHGRHGFLRGTRAQPGRGRLHRRLQRPAILRRIQLSRLRQRGPTRTRYPCPRGTKHRLSAGDGNRDRMR